MPHWVKVLATEIDDLSSVTRIYMVEGECSFSEVALWPPLVQHGTRLHGHVYMHVHTQCELRSKLTTFLKILGTEKWGMWYRSVILALERLRQVKATLSYRASLGHQGYIEALSQDLGQRVKRIQELRKGLKSALSLLLTLFFIIYILFLQNTD